MLLRLFSTFFVIGLISFGGGHPMIPVMQEAAINQHHWMSLQDFTDMIGVAGMSPGPIALNSAIFIGYRVMGLPGAIVTAFGITTWSNPPFTACAPSSRG